MSITLSLFRRPTPVRPRRAKSNRIHLSLEAMEERVVLSSAAAVAPVQPHVQVAPTTTATTSLPVSITGVNLTNVIQNAQGAITGVTGTVTGLLAGHTFTAPLTIGATQPTTAGACPVLDLQLGPINLNLLGLKVHTSQICLDITGQSGPGNLLGNLVCDVGNLLNGTTSLSSITGGVTGLLNTITTDLNSVLTGAAGTTLGGSSTSSILGLLNSSLSQTLGQNLGSPTVGGNSHILDLSVGPVNLDLLGLMVTLDNCHNGPVVVKITAQGGPGNLLGNLLTGLSNLLNNPLSTTTAITSELNTIIGAVTSATSKVA